MHKLNYIAVFAMLGVATPLFAQSGSVGGSTLPGRRIYTAGSRAVMVDGRRCVERTDRDGRVRTECPDTDVNRDDHRIDARIHRQTVDARHVDKERAKELKKAAKAREKYSKEQEKAADKYEKDRLKARKEKHKEHDRDR